MIIPGISDGYIQGMLRTVHSHTFKILEKQTIEIALLGVIIVISLIIIQNQRKIRKELRQLREMMENQDKPQE